MVFIKTKNFLTSLISFFLFLMLINTSLAQGYGEISYGEAVNISGRQRMLSQKISKAYLIRAMGYDNFTTKREMDSSIILFRKQLNTLLTNTKDNSIKKKLQKVSSFWEKFENHLAKTPNIITAQRIMNKNTTLLNLCDDVVKMIENYYSETNNTKSTRKRELLDIIDTSGKQRMLSQRLCLYYAGGSVFTKQNNTYTVNLRTVYSEFDKAITQLVMSSFNDDKVRVEISKLLFFWHNFKSMEIKLFQLKLEISDVYEITNKLTEVFEKITLLYQIIYNQSQSSSVPLKN